MRSATQPTGGMLSSRQAIWVKGYLAQKIGPMTRDDVIYSITQLYNKSTLQPIETVSAIRLNLQRSNCDDCINRPRQMRYPDRVRPPRRGERWEENRKGKKVIRLAQKETRFDLIMSLKYSIMKLERFFCKFNNSAFVWSTASDNDKVWQIGTTELKELEWVLMKELAFLSFLYLNFSILLSSPTHTLYVGASLESIFCGLWHWSSSLALMLTCVRVLSCMTLSGY